MVKGKHKVKIIALSFFSGVYTLTVFIAVVLEMELWYIILYMFTALITMFMAESYYNMEFER